VELRLSKKLFALIPSHKNEIFSAVEKKEDIHFYLDE
jgi:hypothetical protein